MTDSPLSVLPTYGSPTLQNLDLVGSGESTRVRGRDRQYVRFYKQQTYELVTDKVRINEATGDSVPLSVKMVPVEREMVHIKTPGDKNEVITIAEEFHKREHFRHYQNYKQGKTAPMGQAIDDCPYISSAVAIELRSLSVHTEEQFADSADYLCSQIANGWELREYARARCAARNNNKESMEQVNIVRAELDKSNALIVKMQQEMEQLKGKILDPSGQVVESKKAKKVEKV